MGLKKHGNQKQRGEESLGDRHLEDVDQTLAPGLWGCLCGLCPEHPASLTSQAWHLLTVRAEAGG